MLADSRAKASYSGRLKMNGFPDSGHITGIVPMDSRLYMTQSTRFVLYASIDAG